MRKELSLGKYFYFIILKRLENKSNFRDILIGFEKELQTATTTHNETSCKTQNIQIHVNLI